jgi:hypothetical protein
MSRLAKLAAVVALFVATSASAATPAPPTLKSINLPGQIAGGAVVCGTEGNCRTLAEPTNVFVLAENPAFGAVIRINNELMLARASFVSVEFRGCLVSLYSFHIGVYCSTQ